MVGAMVLKQGDGDTATLYVNHAPTTLDCIKYMFFCPFAEGGWEQLNGDCR